MTCNRAPDTYHLPSARRTFACTMLGASFSKCTRQPNYHYQASILVGEGQFATSQPDTKHNQVLFDYLRFASSVEMGL